MRRDRGLMILLVILSLSHTALGRTLYVDRTVSEASDGVSVETAFRKIQEGISDAEAFSSGGQEAGH